jgi:hypothetical protein
MTALTIAASPSLSDPPDEPPSLPPRLTRRVVAWTVSLGSWRLGFRREECESEEWLPQRAA